VVPYTLTLPVATNYVRLWSLDELGQRKAELSVTGNSVATTLTITTNAASIWYELDVSRWMTSFDLWRMRYFTPAELALPSVSGEAAAPDGDRMPNLMKYYLGLPGRTPASPSQFPTGTLLTVSGQRYLAVTYTHDKLAQDVDCTAEVSPDLANWFSGPTYTRVEQTNDLGALEQITIRELTPASGAPKHFMRLRFQRH
jgi:hypothetical protein